MITIIPPLEQLPLSPWDTWNEAQRAEMNLRVNQSHKDYKREEEKRVQPNCWVTYKNADYVYYFRYDSNKLSIASVFPEYGKWAWKISSVLMPSASGTEETYMAAITAAEKFINRWESVPKTDKLSAKYNLLDMFE